MDINIAKTAGFCFGVQRAVDTVYKEIKENKKIYTLGPIIHNEQVVNEFARLGVEILNSEDELKRLSCGTVIIRSHGVPKYIYDLIESRNKRVKRYGKKVIEGE